MSDERDEDEKEHPGEQLKQGLGLLWRAARGAAVGVKKQMNRTELGRSIEGAGRELARAATNVVGRVADEIAKGTGKPGEHAAPPGEEAPPKDDADADAKEEEHDDDFDGVKAPPKKPTGPTPQDPGFRIMVDDDEKKPR